jgi:hypothetical protein
MCPEPIMVKSQALKDYDAPTLDWIETQEFPVRRLFWIADPSHVSPAVKLQDIGSPEDGEALGSMRRVAEMRL